ncbi:zinc finger protein [Macleaya cordata]|uniref:Zinc finger protein n=1 Tax=Macleaya cordata TaxID=56857 RepID=A0A200QF95_MACCD|nr:zinc finger protein [Macleaya cordata]
MADRRRTEKCNGCGIQLAVPPAARSIRCIVCQTVTPVRPINYTYVQPDDPVRQATRWVKGMLNNVSNTIDSVLTSTITNSGSTVPTYSYYLPVLHQPLKFPPVHGKKKALLVGVCYRSRRYELRGSINDVNCMKFLLVEKLGFSKDSILVLTEDEKEWIPTKRNIRRALQWLIEGCKSGDSLVFHYSGHGSQQRNLNGDEVDGYDETLCPLDYETEGMILDDEINTTIVRPLPTGATLHAIIDSCHSGTILDLPFLCKMNQSGYYWEDHSPPSGAYKGTSGGLALSFSACDDHQTSADTSALSGSTMTGAMTYSFIQAMQSAPGLTYGVLLNAMRTAIREAKTGIRFNGPITSCLRKVFHIGLSQEPQLSSSEMFDIYRKQVVL